MPNETLSVSEQKLFDVIVDFITQNQYPPTIRELCRLTGYSSTSLVHKKMKRLKEEGLIDFVPNGKRTIKIVTPTADVVEVVRCKDCEHYGANKTYRPPYFEFAFCYKFHHNIMRENDFCSYGEKKDKD